MKFNKKLFGLLMFVMLVCCVSAASATDVDNITVPDDTNIIADDIVESVDDVEIDDVSGSDDVEADDSVDDSDDEITDVKIVNGGNRPLIDINNYDQYFDDLTGEMFSSTNSPLVFSGTFSNLDFENFIINICIIYLRQIAFCVNFITNYTSIFVLVKGIFY